MTSSELQGQVFVFAGAGGIAEAMAGLLGASAATVAVGYTDPAAAASAATRAREVGGASTRHHLDIADERSVQAFIGEVVEAHGRIDGLFNVAADLARPTLRRDTDCVDVDLDVWRRTLDVTLTGYMLTIRHTVPQMLRHGGGAIVNTSSAAAYTGEPVRVAYAVAKAGIGALTRHVAQRWGRAGIRCNAVAPGPVLTERVAGYFPEDVRERVLASMPTTPLGQPADVAALVEHLLTDAGSWVQGQCLSVDGGMTMRP